MRNEHFPQNFKTIAAKWNMHIEPAELNSYACDAVIRNQVPISAVEKNRGPM